jgi:hypothetical protein
MSTLLTCKLLLISYLKILSVMVTYYIKEVLQ